MATYRPDIDGLRTLAVVPVVLFHAKLPFVTGGFVGVDIFFVISGYLITSILIKDLEDDRFSLLRFYERRIRRIFPALFAVILATLLFCFIFYLPREFEEFFKSILATAFFVSNILFWQQVDYFDIAAELKPLLHTWSLSIEEQFYVFFPIGLFLVYRYARRYALHLVVLVLIASFLLNAWSIDRMPVATFFLIPMRAWELMLGAVLAMGLFRRLPGRSVREAMAWCGLLLLAWGVFGFDKQTPFPGLYALAPCLGSALIIYSGQPGDTIVARMLSLRPLVFIGLISYSLYLWHWPILLAGRYLLIDPPTALETGILVLVSGVVAVLSWRFVEQPFRHRRLVARRGAVFALGGGAMATAALVSVVIWRYDGVPQRLPDEVVALADESRYDHDLRDCDGRSADDIAAGRICRIGDATATPSFALWGDSHAYMMAPAVDSAAKSLGVAGLMMTRGGCAPVLGARPARGIDECNRFSEAAARRIADDPDLKTVLLGGYWRRQSTGSTYEGEGHFFVDEVSPDTSVQETLAVFERSLERVLVRMGKRTVLVIEDIPEIGIDPPRTLALLRRMGRDIDDWSYETPLSEHVIHQRPAMVTFDELAARHCLSVVPTKAVLCPDGRCPAQRDGQVIYRNGDHLSAYGARLLVDAMTTAMAEAINGGSVDCSHVKRAAG